MTSKLLPTILPPTGSPTSSGGNAVKPPEMAANAENGGSAVEPPETAANAKNGSSAVQPPEMADNVENGGIMTDEFGHGQLAVSIEVP